LRIDDEKAIEFAKLIKHNRTYRIKLWLHLTFTLVAAPVLLLQACASAPPPPPPSVAVLTLSNKTCTKDPVLKDAISLTPADKKSQYEISTLVDAGKPCLTSDNTSSNYVVYALPEHGDNHVITVGGVQEPLRTFAPSVSLLDADGKVTRAFADDRFAVLGNTLGVQFRPTPQERYILVHSNPVLVGKSISTVETRLNTGMGYAPATPYHYGYSYQTERGVEGKHDRVYSHEGYVSVIVQAIKGQIGTPGDN
jgi:hypothetical protein